MPDAGLPDSGAPDAGVCQPANPSARVILQSIALYGGAGAQIAVTPEGTVFVAENLSTKRVSRVSPSGQYDVIVPPPLLGGVTGLAWDAPRDRLLIADGHANGNSGGTGADKVWAWSPDGGVETVIASVPNPAGIATSGNEIFVTSFSDRIVYRYTSAGAFIGPIGPTMAERPTAVVVARDGSLLVAGFAVQGQSAAGTRIYRITQAGVLSTFADPGIPDPHGLAVDPSGAVWASYYNSLRILRFDTDGGITSLPGGWIADDAVSGIGVDEKGALYFTVNGSRTTSSPALLKVPGATPICP